MTAVGHVDLDGQTVDLVDTSEVVFDVLVVATGAVLAPGETEGLTRPAWIEKVFTFYTPVGAGLP